MTATPGLRVHGFLPASRANGPGLRAVVWTQGCSLACPGCFNPETHPFAGPAVPVEEVFQWILAAPGIEGITLSGGEPLQQRPAVRRLLRLVKEETGLSVLLFTGYSLDEMAAARDVLPYVDVLMAGRYSPASPKTVHFLTDRYTGADMERVPPAEVVIMLEGDVITTGLQPVPISMSNSPSSITGS